MFAAIVASGMAIGVTLMPANPASPFTTVKEERYAPAGGSGFVGVVGEEHELLRTVQSVSETANVRVRARTRNGTSAIIDHPLPMIVRVAITRMIAGDESPWWRERKIRRSPTD